MKPANSILTLIFILILISSTVESISADIDPRTLFGGYLTVEFNQDTAHVGDNVLITVTASNEGLVDLYPVIIYAPIPSGLKYVSHIVPDKQRQDYNPETGFWDVNRMRHEERGHLKTLIITAKVMPEAAGKELTATAKFRTLFLEGYNINMADEIATARAHTTKITSNDEDNNNGRGKGTGSGNGNGAGNGTGSGNGNGNSLINKIAHMGNLTNMGSENNFLPNLQSGGGGNGKYFEMYNATDKNPLTSSEQIYAIFGILAIIGIILYGYSKGMKNN